MASGPAGYVADGSDPQAWDGVTAAALEVLAGQFEVEPGPDDGDEQRVTWLDTFDWRLHKAGLTLGYVPGRGGSELRLSGPGGEADRIATQPVTGWQASRPHAAAELAAGPVGSRIAGLVAPRALVPVAAASTATTVYNLLNADRKTVARLLVSRPALAGPGERGPLPPRFEVAGIRGYQGQARRAVRLVEAVPGLKAAAGPLLADALRARGRRPGDYSNKVDARITPDMPAGGAAAVILLRLLDTLDANTPGVLADIDTEYLHDLRVSVRRTRSALKLFGDALGLDAGELAHYAAEFKWVGDLTTPTRDLDVHLLDFEDTASSLSAAKPDDLEPFRAYLEQRRRKEFRVLARGLRSPRFTGLTGQWRERLAVAAQVAGSPATAAAAARQGAGMLAMGGTLRSASLKETAGGSVGLLAAERTRAAFAKVAKRGAAITQDSPAESLHDLRKRCKELRYALEFFAPLHDPAASGKVVGELKRLQDCLGEFQDTEIQIGEIRMLAAGMLKVREAPAVTLLAMGEITAGLATRQRAARADFERRFAAFAGTEGRRRMSALLRGTGVRYRGNADIRDL